MNNIIRARIWPILFIAFIILFNIPGYAFANNLKIQGIIFAWFVNLFAVFAFSTILSFLKEKAGKWMLILLFIISLAPNLIVFTYLCIAQIQMSNDMFWVIFASNSSESNEYFEQFISPFIWMGATLYVLTSIFLLYKSLRSLSSSVVPLDIKRNIKLFVISLVIPVLIISLQYFSGSVGPIDFYKSSVRYLVESYQMEREMTARKDVSLDISCRLNSDSHTFVVIIGESLTRHHMQLYDYPRPTTPKLESMKDELYIYNDVVSPNTHTIPVLKSALTFADYDHPEYYLQKPSIVELFKKAGFETYWISTQAIIDKWGCSYGVIARGADHVFDLSITKQPDAVVLPYIEKILKEETSGNRVIFVHLMGSHHTYRIRYPMDFAYFNQGNYPIPDRPYLKEEDKKIIDEYDNSVRYSDFVISSIIKEVKAEDDLSSFVLFFSDHGEEVFDLRDMCGHTISNPSSYQCDVPFFLWCSDAYLAEHLPIVFQPNRPFSTENLIHGVSSLAGLKYKDYNPRLSIFDKEFEPQKRMVGDNSYQEIIDYTNTIRKRYDSPENIKKH